MTQLGNPWLEKSGKLYDLENRIVMPDRVVENIRKIKVTGLEAYHKFLEKRVLTQEEALTDPIPACNLQLIRDEVDRKPAKPTERSIVSDMKSQQVKLIDIISAHQAGRPNLDAEVLSHENSLLPPTLTNKGNMHHGNKADILKLICPDDVRYENAPVTPTALIIDASVLVRQRRPIGCSKIGDYVDKILWPEISLLFDDYDRIDWVTDNWFPNSIKSAVRETRGAGRTRIVDEQTKIPSNWQEFMRDDANKIQLFPVLGNMLLRKQIPEVSYFLEYLLMHRIPRITLYMQ